MASRRARTRAPRLPIGGGGAAVVAWITYERTLSRTDVRSSRAASLSAMRSRPDVLVLGGGGVLGEAWMMGVLAGIEDGDRVDLRGCEHFVGTSAGSIVAAHLVAGDPPRRPSTIGSRSRASCRVAAAPADGLARRRPGRRAPRR